MARELKSPCAGCKRYDIPECITNCQTLKFIQKALRAQPSSYMSAIDASGSGGSGFTSDDSEM